MTKDYWPRVGVLGLRKARRQDLLQTCFPRLHSCSGFDLPSDWIPAGGSPGQCECVSGQVVEWAMTLDSL